MVVIHHSQGSSHHRRVPCGGTSSLSCSVLILAIWSLSTLFLIRLTPVHPDVKENILGPVNKANAPPVDGLPVAFPHVRRLFDELCQSEQKDSLERLHSEDCIIQEVSPDPQDHVQNCSPFETASLFGLRWCTWDKKTDAFISAPILENIIPSEEQKPLNAFRNAFENKPRGIVIDAGSQIGLFSAAALQAGHYTISIDARREHVQMNMVSRLLNNKTNNNDGMIVYGALADRCNNQWATIPRKQQERGNPGATNIVGRVVNGWPRFESLDEMYQTSMVPLVTLDAIVDRALEHLPPTSVERRIYALKIDIEGFELFGLKGSTRMLSHLQPGVIVMELFVKRIHKSCSARKFIRAIAQVGYQVDVSPRLGRGCIGGSCTGMKPNSPELEAFLADLEKISEMDLIFTRQ